MNWQDLIVFLIVVAAALYAGRIFWPQFDGGKKPDEEQCAHCAPGEKAGHKPVRISTQKPKTPSARN